MVNLLTFLLYLIEILHQTTTMLAVSGSTLSCILLKFYIKPQLVLVFTLILFGCILLKFYIKPQPAASVKIVFAGCILLKFYIKPQHVASVKIVFAVVSY